MTDLRIRVTRHRDGMYTWQLDSEHTSDTYISFAIDSMARHAKKLHERFPHTFGRDCFDTCALWDEPIPPAWQDAAHLQERIMDALRELGPSTCIVIADAIGATPEAVRLELLALVAAGRISQANRSTRGYTYTVIPQQE